MSQVSETHFCKTDTLVDRDTIHIFFSMNLCASRPLRMERIPKLINIEFLSIVRLNEQHWRSAFFVDSVV